MVCPPSALEWVDTTRATVEDVGVGAEEVDPVGGPAHDAVAVCVHRILERTSIRSGQALPQELLGQRPRRPHDLKGG